MTGTEPANATVDGRAKTVAISWQMTLRPSARLGKTGAPQVLILDHAEGSNRIASCPFLGTGPKFGEDWFVRSQPDRLQVDNLSQCVTGNTHRFQGSCFIA